MVDADILADILNIYMVYLGYRPGYFREMYNKNSILKVNNKLIKSLGLYISNKNYTGYVTKNKLNKIPSSDKQTGQLLGFYCIHNKWDDIYTERITVQIQLENLDNEYSQLVVFLCENKKINANNASKLVEHINILKQKYKEIIKLYNLPVKRLYVTYNVHVINKENDKYFTSNKISSASFLKWKLSKKPLIVKGYSFF